MMKTTLCALLLLTAGQHAQGAERSATPSPNANLSTAKTVYLNKSASYPMHVTVPQVYRRSHNLMEGPSASVPAAYHGTCQQI